MPEALQGEVVCLLVDDRAIATQGKYCFLRHLITLVDQNEAFSKLPIERIAATSVHKLVGIDGVWATHLALEL